MKTLKHFIVAVSLLVVAPTIGMSHQFYVTLFGRDDTDGSIGLQVFDGVEFIKTVRYDSGHTEAPGDPDENGDPGPPIITDAWTVYLATVPDSWLNESRGVSFHIPGHGLTGFHPVSAQIPSYDVDIDTFPRRQYPNPDLHTTTAGNRLLLGRWWSFPSASVARLNTWDNDNPYWPCAGVDLISSTQHTFWRWMHSDNSGTGAQLAMDLDYLHRLTLRGRSTLNTLTFDPDAGTIRINNLPLVTAANAEVQLSSALSNAFVGRSSAGMNLGIGTELRTQTGALPTQIVLGLHNEARADGVFIVGTGSGNGSEPRKNGLRILDDGTVLIRPKADLPMAAEFQNGPRP